MIEQSGHIHDDGNICDGCRFKAELAENLQWAATQSDEVWHDLVGELLELTAGCVMSLTALRMAQATDNGDPRDNAAMAGAVISRLGGAIDELWHALMDDDGDIDDD